MISISPNPTSDFIEISGLINPSVNCRVNIGEEIKIFNTFGECVMVEQIHPKTPSHRMNIEHLPIGLYFIQIGNYSEKFMVLR